MKNLSLRTKLTLGFTIPIFLVLLTTVWGVLIGQQTGESVLTLTEFSIPAIVALDEIRFANTHLISSANEFILDELLGYESEGLHDEANVALELSQIDEAIERHNQALAGYQELVNIRQLRDETDINLAVSIDTAAQAIQDVITSLLAAHELGEPFSPDEVAEMREVLEVTENEFLAAVNAAVEHEREEMEEIQNTLDSSFQRAASVSVITMLMGVTISIWGGVYLYLNITRQLTRVKITADGLRSGQMHMRTDVTSNDEIGQLGQTLNMMADYLSDSMQALTQAAAEAQAARERAEEADKVKSAFLASMSHELRTPLNSVINYTRFVIKGVMGPVSEKQVETLTKVADSGKHLLSLINDVLDISKIESGSLNLFIEDNVDVADLMRTTAATAESLIIGKPVKIQLELPADLPVMSGDKQRLRQIMLNIVSNACKFTEEGQITLSARFQADELILAVEDTGPGIRPEDRAAVFEPFKQTETGLRQGSGTGLGMPISKSLAEAHGGRLWFKSTPGAGSTFYVALPLNADLRVATVV